MSQETFAQRSAGKSSLRSLVVEPNPTDNTFNIHFNSIIAEATTVEVFNLFNQKIYHDEIINTNEYELFLNKLPSGTYLLKLSDKTNSIIKRIIKK